VRSRAEAAGVATESVGEGFIVRDPWQTAVLIAARSPVS
jgi:hypothetical protein